MSISFTHSVSISSDIRMQRVIRTLGMEGVGVYWMIMEALCRDEGSLALVTLSDLAFAMHVKEDLVRELVLDSGLFEFDENDFWSKELIEDLLQTKEESERKERLKNRASKAASRRWKKEKAISDSAHPVMLDECSSNAQASSKHMLNECSSIRQASQEKEDKESPPLPPLSPPSDSPFSPPYNPPSEKEEREDTPVDAPTVEQKKPVNVISLDSLLLIKVPDGYREAFREFLAFRKQIKKTMTPHAVDLAVKKLNRELCTDDQRQECLRMSILNGWQGVFPEALLKQRDGPKTNPSGFKQRTKTDFDYWGDSPEEARDGVQNGQ